MRSDRRPGFDWNFNVPKSVSLVHAYSKDDRIIQAMRQANLDAILLMQENAATRVRANGVKEGDRITGNIVCAEIIHRLAIGAWAGWTTAANSCPRRNCECAANIHWSRRFRHSGFSGSAPIGFPEWAGCG